MGQERVDSVTDDHVLAFAVDRYEKNASKEGKKKFSLFG